MQSCQIFILKASLARRRVEHEKQNAWTIGETVPHTRPSTGVCSKKKNPWATSSPTPLTCTTGRDNKWTTQLQTRSSAKIKMFTDKHMSHVTLTIEEYERMKRISDLHDTHMCVHHPYCCVSHRHKAHWCTRCMSQLLFPEYHPAPACRPSSVHAPRVEQCAPVQACAPMCAPVVRQGCCPDSAPMTQCSLVRRS